MGTWGTAISSNDSYKDVYSEFMDLYNDGLEVQEITDIIVKRNSEIIDDPEDGHNFWFAIAMAQWQCKALDNNVFNKVKQIVENDDDIKSWHVLEASRKDIDKRKGVLKAFIEKLSTENPKAKRRKKKILRDSIFQKGDCLVFKLHSGNYGGAFVLVSEKQTEYGMNLIATTTLDQKEIPTVEDFKNSYVLIRKIQWSPKHWRDSESISWYYSQFFKKSTINLTVVGNLKVDKEYHLDKDFRSFSQWDNIKETVESNPENIKERGKPDKTLRLKKLI
jgi:hypothetical protein